MTSLSNGNTYSYVANGNMIQRIVTGVTWNLSYNIENRALSLGNGTYAASYLYDGDGARVAQFVNGVPTYYFAGGAYEVTTDLSGNETGHKFYYSIAGQSIATSATASGMDDDSGENTF